MDENNAIDIAESGFSDFEAAFNEEDGYQTEETGNEAQEETTEAETEEAQDDTGEETPTEEGAESGGEQESSAQPTEDKPQETFTIRVNKEDRNVSREEIISLAQKGADYDRTKGQLTEARQTIQTLQQQVGESQAVMEVLQMISEESKMPIDQIVEQFHLGKDFFRSTVRCNLPTVHDDHTLRLGSFVHMMGDQHDGDPLLPVQPQDSIHNFTTATGIQHSGRLV
jgi:hypothetical protein